MGLYRRQSIVIATRHTRGYRHAAAVFLTLCIAASSADRAKADAGGLSFWLPGTFGSLAAAAGVPGWAYSTIYLHAQSAAQGNKEFVHGASVVAGLNARADAVVERLTYTFATPVLGGQASVSVLGAGGQVKAGIDATLTSPRGNTLSGSVSDTRTTFADVFYQGALKWNHGVHNTMIYVTGNIPSGTYDHTRLANLSFGFVAVDDGVGYTYLNPTSGNEFSVVAGFTYSFINPDTQYQNGIDFHVDWGASHFLSKNVQIGIAGYFFQQLTGDSGLGVKLGDFKGRVAGIGPQIGFLFPVGEAHPGYLNLKAYRDFAAENRAEGYTSWVTLAITPAAPEHPGKGHRSTTNLVATRRPHVSYGSKAPFGPSAGYFRSSPRSGHFQSPSACLKGARRGSSPTSAKGPAYCAAIVFGLQPFSSIQMQTPPRWSDRDVD